jgi:hypothetical protein
MEIIERVVSSTKDKIVIVEDFYKFCPEIWDKIKDFAGIKKDFPIEVIGYLKAIRSFSFLRKVFRLTFIPLIPLDELNPELRMMCGDYGDNCLWINGKVSDKMGKREMKKILLRTFWTRSHPDLYNFVFETINKMMCETIDESVELYEKQNRFV